MENKIPTAEEFYKSIVGESSVGYTEEAMIEFAKLHVEAALVSASKVDIKVEKRSQYGKYRKWQKVKENEEFDLFQFEMKSSPDKVSILKSYPLTNIK